MLPVRLFTLLLVAVAVLLAAPTAHADTPLGPARHVPCPVPTDDPARYEGGHAPFRCRFAVTDPNGRVSGAWRDGPRSTTTQTASSPCSAT